MKKLTTAIWSLCVCLLFGVFLIACDFDFDEHACTFRSKWVYDETYHWCKCEDDSCSKTTDKEMHVPGIGNVCTVCGAEVPNRVSQEGWNDVFSSLCTENLSLVITMYENGKFITKTIERSEQTYHYTDTSTEYYLENAEGVYLKYLFGDGEWTKNLILEDEYLRIKNIVDKYIAYCSHLQDDFMLFEYDFDEGFYSVDSQNFQLEDGNYIYDSSYNIHISDFTVKRIDALIYLGVECQESEMIKFSITLDDANFKIPLVPSVGLSYELCGSYYKLTGRGSSTDTHIVVPLTYNGLDVIDIADGAFFGDSIITDLTLSNNITHIGNNAFAECDNIGYIDLGESVVEIGEGAFYRNDNRYTLIMHDSVRKIGKGAFDWRTSYAMKGKFYFYGDINKYATIEIDSDRGRFLSNHTFYYNDELLTDLVIDTATHIYDGIFAQVKLLTVTIGDQVTSVGKAVFFDDYFEPLDIYYQGNLEQFLAIEKSESWAGSHGGNYNLYLNGNLLTNLNFLETGMTEIPNELGDNAFSGCGSLSTVIIPNSVTNIGNGVFFGCGNLANITIPGSVTCIGNNAFRECESLTSIIIPEGVTSIGSNVFGCCYNLTSITIPERVTSIGCNAFEYCYNLASITIPESVTSIGVSAFLNCSGLTSITMSEGVTDIGDYAFAGCSGLASIILPESVTNIGADAFNECESLTTITISESVMSIGCGFYGCNALKYNQYDNAYYLGSKDNPYFALIKAIDEDIYTCEINPNTKLIAGYAFSGCCNLTEVTISDGVTVICYGAFYECSSLISVTIPDSVLHIEKRAFYTRSKCSIYYRGNVNEWEDISIDSQNGGFDGIRIYFYSENQPMASETYELYYWHYDTDGKTVIVW